MNRRRAANAQKATRHPHPNETVEREVLFVERRRRVEYRHTGWRKIGGAWHYLHAGGAIGPGGEAAEVAVSLPDALRAFALPPPGEEGDPAAAVRSSLRLLDLAPDRMTFPLLAAVYRAALGECDFALHLVGPTGVFKSELAALCQQHYGAGLDARHLPGGWASTGNALEGIAHAAKDALLVIDDFAPSGGPGDVQRLHREADRIVRAQGNHAGRQRMNRDGGLRPARPPRGLILSTGEDIPRGQSLRARLLSLEVGPGDVARDRLTACQKDAADGLYALTLAHFLKRLAPAYDELRGRLRAEAAGLRDEVLDCGQHARTPDIVAHLALGLRHFLCLARNVGAVTEQEAEGLWGRGWHALIDAAEAQAEHHTAAEPAAHFRRLLAGVLASGRGHLASPTGGVPADCPESWGWRREDTHEGVCWRPQGRRVGWLDGADLYLEPEAAFAEAQELARQQGDKLSISPKTLHKRLKEKGLLKSWDEKRQRNTVRRTLEGKKDREVLHLAVDTLSLREPSEPSADAHRRANSREETGDSRGRSDGSQEKPSAETVHKNGQKPADELPGGRFGRSGATEAAGDWKNTFPGKESSGPYAEGY